MITKEKLSHHIDALKARHQNLDIKITELYNHHADDVQVETLKKQKLLLKEEIAQNVLKLEAL
jgi:hypothetical protein